MRAITYTERNKHGCWFCNDMVKEKEGKDIRCFCPHENCPYHKELDAFDSYEEYMEKAMGETPLEFFLPRGGKRALKYKVEESR